jgi:PAS domain S-box-containing protein
LRGARNGREIGCGKPPRAACRSGTRWSCAAALTTVALKCLSTTTGPPKLGELITAAPKRKLENYLALPMRRDSTSQFQHSATQCFLGGIGVAAVTFFGHWLELGIATVGFAYLILVALLSLIGSFIGSVVLAIVAAAALVYFFASPLLSLWVEDPKDVMAVAAFLTTAIVITGLTAQLRATQTLRESEAQWREIFEHNPVMYFIVDPAGTVLSVNAFGAAQLGYSVGELVGQSVLNVFFEEDRAFVQNNVRVCLENLGQSTGWEVRKIRKDGTVLWVRENAKAVRRAGNQLIVLIACEDITERKRAEDALRQSEMYLAEAQRLSHTGSFGWRVATGEIVWSEESFRIFGYDPTTKPTLALVLERIHPEDRAAVEQFVERVAREAKDWELERRLLMPDGSVKHGRVVARAVKDAAGKLEFVGAVMDVTASRRAEEQLNLLRAELAHVTRVTTVGELTAAIAHEVNQPLTGLVTSGNACLHWLSGETPNLPAARRAVERMINDGTRAGEVISRIRAMVRKSPPRTDRLNINSTLMEVIALVRGEVERNGISLRTELSNDLPLVVGDRIQLQQVILNLIVNAIEAMSGVVPSQRELLVASAKNGPNSTLVTVRDSGTGLNETSLDRLFDAFYTTKASGMGMGLAISRTIIEAHGGRLWATPNVPQGAIFQFSLPTEGGRVS